MKNKKMIPLDKGYSGDSLYKVIEGNKTYILRMHRKEKSLERKKLEYLYTKNAQDLGIGPTVERVSEDYHSLAVTFVEGEHPCLETFEKTSLIVQLAANFRKMHKGPQFGPAWSVFDYMKVGLPQELSPEMLETLVILEKIESCLRNLHFPHMLCHNDIQPSNVLISEDNIYFIDWDNAGIYDPFYDLGRSCIEFAFDADQERLFLSEYLEREISEGDELHLFLMKHIFLAKSAFWMFWRLGRLAEEDQKYIKRVASILEREGYIFEGLKEIVYWKDLSLALFKLFIRKSKTHSFSEKIRKLELAN